MIRLQPLYLLAILEVSGCSQKFQDVRDTASLAIFGEQSVQLSPKEIEDLPYASIYAQIDESSRAFMVLAFADVPLDQPGAAPELKWLSADEGMLVTQSGRLIKTLNLPQGNLLASNSEQPDPLELGLHLPSTPSSWSHTLDWLPGYHFGYQADSTFQQVQPIQVVVNEKTIIVRHFIETVTIPKLSIRYQNDYWIDPANGNVVKSRQKIAPNLPFIEITLLKPYQ